MVKGESHIPKIRFQGFTDEWNSIIIDDLVNQKIIDKPMDGNHGEIHPTSDDYVISGIPFVMANDIFNGQLHLDKSKKISYELSKTLRKGFAQEGDVLLTHKATIGETAIVPKLNDPYIVLTPQVTYYRILQQNKIHRYFLKSNFQSPSFVKCLQKAVTGATRLYIGITEQRSLKLNLTCLQEQTKIGNFFQKIDQVIELQQKVLDTARDYKKSMLQKMFPQKGEKVPQIRFDGFSGDWEERKLSAILKQIKSYSLSRNVEVEESTTIKYIHYGDIHKGIVGIVENDRSLLNIQKNDYDTFLQKGDLVLTDASEDYQGIATPCIINFVPDENNIVAGLHTIAIRPKKQDPIYLYYFFGTNVFKKHCYKIGTGMKVFGITYTNLVKFCGYFPTLEEQQKIGEFFQKLDQRIEQHEKKLQSYQNLKKAMLQRLFV